MTSIQEYECIFCKESFENKEALQIHFRKHGDPNFNQNNKGRVQSASPTHDSRDGVEMVSCDVCTEVFPTISKAITHKHKVHPEHDAKYFCPWCGKLFTMKHLYNKHMQANHSNLDKSEEKSFHCDCCNVDFYIPAAVLYHNKFFHRQDTDIPPFGQSKKLRMYNQEVISIYYCSFCGEEYENKVNLHKHASDDHDDENQSPDVVMRCPLCDAIFYHLDAYELHLTFHTSDDLYSERSEMADDVNEYSLESVPPIMEKVESCEPQQDAETTMMEVGIEDFLEQALEEPENITIKKNKKHKKHKKSKKSAITLDEFLNMNKDVFGEGLDFEGVEEVPTRVIAKKLKVVKKTPTTNLQIAPELEKLRKHGIVIKKNPGHSTSVPTKGQSKKSLKSIRNKNANDAQYEPKVSASVEMLDKIINQGNNQIKIVTKSNKDNYTQGENISHEASKFNDMENYEIECDSTKKEIGEIPLRDNSFRDKSVALENNADLRDAIEKKVNDSTLPTVCHPLAANTNGSMNNSSAKSVETEEEVNKKSTSLKSLLYSNSTKVESSTNNNYDNLESINNVDGMRKKCDKHINNAEIQNKIDSLSSLKHLSHLITVKPVIKNMTSKAADSSSNKNDFPTSIQTAKGDAELSCLDIKDTIGATDINNDDNLLSISNKSAVVKSLSPPPKSDSKNLTAQENEVNDLDIGFKNTTNVQSVTSKINLGKNINSKSSEIIQSQHITTNTGFLLTTSCEPNCNDKQETTNLLKHLTGITAKSVNAPKFINKHNTSMPIKNTSYKNVDNIIPQKDKVNDNEIEIFNIDDSDDEIDNGSKNSNENVNNSTQHIDVLKSLGKNITIKSLNNNMAEKNTLTPKGVQLHDALSNEKRYLTDDDQKPVKCDARTAAISNKKAVLNQTNEKDTALKNALKNLSKNITVKSRNSSPSHTVTSKDSNVLNFEEEFNEEPLPMVKITEINNCEDDELETDLENISDNMLVQSPEDSQSDIDVNDEMDMEDADFENQIKVSMLKKNEERVKSHESESCASEMKHLPEDIVENAASPGDNPSLDITKNLGNQISIKPLKHARKEMKQESIANAEEMFGQTACQSITNQRMSNQVNTINKEVTVKTFKTQTKTVVQEITTTVTKTIKTVNQTLKQEVRNVGNYSSTSRLPQKVQGMKVHQQSRNLQGIVVRHASPLVRPKIRNSPPVKPAVGTPVRQSSQVIPVGTSVKSSNQIVPVRPRSNITSISNPRMPSVPKIRPSTSNQNNSTVTRPLKVSPEAMISSVKRPNIEETSGPFSCFKKPKESLIPVSDVTTLNSSDPELLSEYSSLSKSSCMNMVSTSKGKSVTTSTRMKSEVNATSHQLSRLNNSGIKVTKTSQSKQIQVHENNEVNTSQRTTLEAIQKLQKQGLLVKKPRLDIKDKSDDSNNSDDNSTDNDI